MTHRRQRALILGLIGLGLILAGFFGFRSLRAMREFDKRRPPALSVSDVQTMETDVELVRGWMTIGFIARTYHLPPGILYQALDISPNGNKEKSLEQLNEEFFPDQPGHVLAIVKAAIASRMAFPTGLPPLTPIPADTAQPPIHP
jgi:hypothetical protein